MLLGPLVGEPPEPLSEPDLKRLESKLRNEWDSMVTLEKRDMQLLLGQVKWLQRRLQRVEEAVLPLVEAIRG